MEEEVSSGEGRAFLQSLSEPPEASSSNDQEYREHSKLD